MLKLHIFKILSNFVDDDLRKKWKTKKKTHLIKKAPAPSCVLQFILMFAVYIFHQKYKFQI